ncbi:unnamed protein product [Pipistrellus nathusii]|uniref:Uncharacterized protein n=1 Tax=Pipistrellus nathusii TaxID=59473 RepID=A0ABP0AET5_PIPNA
MFLKHLAYEGSRPHLPTEQMPEVIQHSFPWGLLPPHLHTDFSSSSTLAFPRDPIFSGVPWCQHNLWGQGTTVALLLGPKDESGSLLLLPSTHPPGERLSSKQERLQALITATVRSSLQSPPPERIALGHVSPQR